MTIKEIANIAGVSRGTVDRVLNGRGGVSIKTTEKIQQIVKSAKYVPNLAGINLSAKRKKLRFAYVAMRPSGAMEHASYAFLPPSVMERKAFLAEYGVDVQIRQFDMNDYITEIALLDQLYKDGINGIAMIPVWHPAVTEKVRELSKAGIPIVTYGSDLENSDRIAYVGADHYHCGRTAAQLIRLLTHGKANIAVVSSDNVCLEGRSIRMKGFEDKLEESYPDIQIVEKRNIHEDDFVCYTTIKSILERNPDLDAIFVNSTGAVGACHALCESPRHIRSVFYDDENLLKMYLNNGVIDMLINRYPDSQGSVPLDILYKYLTMGILPSTEHIHTDISIKVMENCSALWL
jgi:LacI family transcriptional regulator